MTAIEDNYYICFVPAPYCKYAIIHYNNNAKLCSFYKADKNHITFLDELEDIVNIKFTHDLDKYFAINPYDLRQFGISPHDCELKINLNNDFPEIFV